MKSKTTIFGLSLCISGLFLAFATAPAFAGGGKGMTWEWRKNDFPNASNNFRKKVVHLVCSSPACNAYQGDTSCQQKRRILCVKTSGNHRARPPYKVLHSGGHGASYEGWVSRPIKFGPKVKGIQLTSRQVADQMCGGGWRMAEFHDGRYISGMSNTQHYGGQNSPSPWNQANSSSGGWQFHAKFSGNVGPNSQLRKSKTQNGKRFWVASNTTDANCWD